MVPLKYLPLVEIDQIIENREAVIDDLNTEILKAVYDFSDLPDIKDGETLGDRIRRHQKEFNDFHHKIWQIVIRVREIQAEAKKRGLS